MACGRASSAQGSRRVRPVDLRCGTMLISTLQPICSQRGCSPRTGSEDPAVAADRLSGLRGGAESLPVIASIPSPHTGTIDLGPFVVHMYGLMLLLAIAACVGLTGFATCDAAATGISSCASRSGASRPGSSARVSTTTSRAGTRCPTRSGRASSRSGRAVSASGAGSSSGRSRARSSSSARAASVTRVCGCGRAGAAARAGHRPDRQLVQPGALRQADRPAVGAEIDIEHRVTGYERSQTFHPTFLYELIYDLGWSACCC